jgi:hypothetical protein
MSEVDDQIKGVRNWLQKQGYTLEMRVSQSLPPLGFIQGWHYEDPETNENREIDIITTSYTESSQNILLLQAIIECKYSQDPIVAFTYGRNLVKSPIEFWVPSNSLGRQTLNKIIAANEVQEFPIFRNLSPIAYTLKRSYINEEEGNVKGYRDLAYDAVMSSVKASYALSKMNTEKISFYPTKDKTGAKPAVYIGIPTIIFGGPIFICFLDENNEIMIEPIDELLLEWSYPKVGTMMIRVIQEKIISKLRDDIIQSMKLFSGQFNNYLNN